MARLGSLCLAVLRKAVDTLFDVVFKVIYFRRPQRLPSVKDSLLLQPAICLAEKIRNRKLKSVDVVQAYISRIQEVQLLNAVVDDRFAEALEEAAAIDDMLKSTDCNQEQLAEQKPFLGVPLTTKSLVAVKGLLHDVGITMRKGVRASADADAITAMRDAGAVPLAVTNVSELAMWWESNNTVHGRTKNPYDLRRIPGGSSGGEGSLISAGGSVIGIGTDIGGSIRMPAFFNGIFGHKPSPGIVSNGGQFPEIKDIQQRFLGTGPMCRYAQDLKPMMKVLAGKNASKLGLDSKVNLLDIKVFYMESCGDTFRMSSTHTEVQGALQKVIEYFREIGLTVREAQFDNLKHSFEMWNYKMYSGNCPTFAQILKECNCEVQPYLEMFRWLCGLSKHTFPALALLINERLTPSKESRMSQKFCKMCDELMKEFEDLLGDNGVFIFPTHPTPAPFHNLPTFRPYNFAYTGIFNVLQLPATACPVEIGKSGLPVGVQVVASRYQDSLCLSFAEEIEKAFGGWSNQSCTMESVVSI